MIPTDANTRPSSRVGFIESFSRKSQRARRVAVREVQMNQSGILFQVRVLLDLFPLVLHALLLLLAHFLHVVILLLEDL